MVEATKTGRDWDAWAERETSRLLGLDDDSTRLACVERMTPDELASVCQRLAEDFSPQADDIFAAAMRRLQSRTTPAQFSAILGTIDQSIPGGPDRAKEDADAWDDWAAKEEAAVAEQATTQRAPGWDAALDRMVEQTRAAAVANWRDLALRLAAADDELAALVVGLLADGIEEPFRARLVAAMKRATAVAQEIRRADA